MVELINSLFLELGLGSVNDFGVLTPMHMIFILVILSALDLIGTLVFELCSLAKGV